MSRLVSRILLTVFMLPAGALFFLFATVLAGDALSLGEAYSFIFAGGLTWMFVAGYWILLWRGSVQWNRGRIKTTIAAALGAALAGVMAGITSESVMRYSHGSFGSFMGSTIALLLWLIATVFIWRETAAERGQRLSASATGIVCPTCGYNLTGLTATRCPECGSQLTLDELLARQPGKADVEVEA